MAKTAADVIKVAKSEVGYLEKKTNAKLDSKTANAGYNNWNKYARDMDKLPEFFNGLKNGFFWCAVFVCWCFTKVFGADGAMQMLFLPKKSAGASCTYLAGRFKAKGRLFTTPEAGDLAFFTADGGKTYYHIGIVTKTDKNYVYTVEGNTSSGSVVIANGGGVFEKKYKKNSSNIRYGRPPYEKADPKPAETKKPQTENPKAVRVDMFLNKNVKGQIIDIGLKVDRGSLWYQVHTLKGKWLPKVTGYDPNDFENGYAGNHTLIDAIRVYYTTPAGEPYKQARYSVRTAKSGARWLPEQVDNSMKNGMDGYAGNLGEAITEFKMRVDNE